MSDKADEQRTLSKFWETYRNLYLTDDKVSRFSTRKQAREAACHAFLSGLSTGLTLLSKLESVEADAETVDFINTLWGELGGKENLIKYDNLLNSILH